MKRREFLSYFSLGLVGPAFANFFNIKKQSVQHLYPYVVPPKGVVPGVANWYASVCKQCPAGCGIRVKIREGRAKKIEGNPDCPVNEGRLCARGQAGLQVLYNPDRVTEPMINGEGGFRKISWDEAEDILAKRLSGIRDSGRGANIVFLTDPLRGSLAKLVQTFAASFGSDRVFSYEVLGDEALIAANSLAFNHPAIPEYDIENASYIVSLGANFLDTWSSPVHQSVAYGKMRDKDQGIRNHRGWVTQFESRLSLTGANADHWLPIKPGSEGMLALGMARIILERGWYHRSIADTAEEWLAALPEFTVKKVSRETGVAAEEIEAVAKEFAHAKAPLALCGGAATAQTSGTINAFAANILNYLTGNIGKDGGVKFPSLSQPEGLIEQTASHQRLRDLFDAMGDEKIDAVFLRGVNPLYDQPSAYGLSDKLAKVPLVVSVTSFLDETAQAATLVLPESSYLESWGDYVAPLDGGRASITISQPVVEPVHKTKTLGDILLSVALRLGGETAAALPFPGFLAYLKSSWNGLYENALKSGVSSAPDFTAFWESSVAQGGLWNKEAKYSMPSKLPSAKELKEALKTGKTHESEGEFEFSLLPYPSTALYDGRGANQPWLQQLPEPLVTATWGTWAEINPETAKELGVKEGDLLTIETRTGQIKAPAYIFHGLEPKTIAVPIGQGHKAYGRYAKDRGQNVLRALRPAQDSYSGALAWASTKVKITKGLVNEPIIKTEPDLDLPGLENGLRELDREIVQWIPPEELDKLRKEELEPITALPTRDLRPAPHFLSGLGLAKYRESRFQPYKYRWGMVIDLDKCTGCSACMVSCYAENNLPIVSPDQMAIHRHKNWIRVDRYWEGEYPNIRAKAVPINCFQCGNAPCESVCPVYASYHTKDGLNGQVYQRCVGTRYCNANCPYRSRLFNWLNSEWPEPLNMQLNPDVSVRSSGITDKCSFCVQRIRETKDIAKDEDRRVRDGEIQPACAQTCPSGAITFGDLKDPNTKVSMLTRDPRRYRMLEEMNTEPAVIYLKAVRKGAEGEKKKGRQA